MLFMQHFRLECDFSSRFVAIVVTGSSFCHGDNFQVRKTHVCVPRKYLNPTLFSKWNQDQALKSRPVYKQHETD